jgi:hypothetical protein
MNNHRIYQASGPSPTRLGQECSRILSAAVINAQFRQMLLANPGKAIEAGYAGESFHLGREEKNRLISIRATSLADFASQMNRTLEVSRTSLPYAAGD